MKTTLRTAYTVRIYGRPSIYGKDLGRRLVDRNRARRIAKWLRARGVDAVAAPFGKVTCAL